MLGALARVGARGGLPVTRARVAVDDLRRESRRRVVLGWAVTRLPPASYRRPFLGIGVCGALTTFATLQLELLRMLDARSAYALALAYAAASLAGGLGGVRLGLARRRAATSGARRERRCCCGAASRCSAGTGAVARYVVSTAVARRSEGWFPYGTLAVNLSGSALLGLRHGAGAARRRADARRRRAARLLHDLLDVEAHSDRSPSATAAVRSTANLRRQRPARAGGRRARARARRAVSDYAAAGSRRAAASHSSSLTPSSRAGGSSSAGAAICDSVTG